MTSTMMQYEILDQPPSYSNESFDFNKANICFVHPLTLQKLHISQYAYRKLITSLSSQIVIIFPNPLISEQILSISTELKATLKLQPQQKIKIERTALKVDTSKYEGFPTFKVAERVEFILIQNQLVELIESSMISKLIKEPFYFKLGQEFRITLNNISETFIRQLSPNVRKKWKKVLERNKEQFARVFVEGVRYTDNKVLYHKIWDNNKSQYFIFDPIVTSIHLEKSRFINKPNQAKVNLTNALESIYELEPYERLKEEIDKIAQSGTSVILLDKRKHLGVNGFLKYVTLQNKAYFYYFDAEMEYNLSTITSYIEESYTKSPAIIYLDNIEWVYTLHSGNLQPKRNSFKFLEKLIETFRQNLLKKGNQYPLVLIIGYNQNLFEMENLDGYHTKLKLSKADIERINKIVLQQHQSKFTKQQFLLLQQSSKTISFQILQSILFKKKQFKDIITAIENTVKTQKVAQIPKVKWDDIGGLDIAKDEIIQTILFPKMYPQIFDDLIRPRSGLLFYGPPGTGKTLLAKCIANECKMNFISVKGPEMLNMYIGQSEKNVRETFERAFESKPCIIFFDELDALIPKRGKSNDSGQVMDRIVAELLSQMDNAWKVGDIFVIGATNRPDLLDPSIMRPGRFDKQIYLGICYEKQQRVNILKAQTKKLKLDEGVDLQAIVDELPLNFTGADFYGLTSKALTIAIQKLVARIQSTFDPNQKDWNSHLQQFESEGVVIQQEDLLEALKHVKPSVSLEELKKFEQLKSKYS